MPRYEAFLLSNFATKFHRSLSGVAKPLTTTYSREDIVAALDRTLLYSRSIQDVDNRNLLSNNVLE